MSELTLGPGTTLAIGSGHVLNITANSTNNGTLRANTGATLSLQSGAFNNTGGMIEALSGSTVKISGVTVTGGNLSIAGAGVLELASATLGGVAVANSPSGIVRALSGVNTLFGDYNDAAGSQMRVNDGAKVILPGGVGSVTLNGGIHLDSAGADTVLEIGLLGLVVNGPGNLVLSNNANNRVIGGGAGATVTFGPNFTVQGAGQIGGDTLTINNQGTIAANGTNSLVINNRGTMFSNQGALKATGTGGLALADPDVTNQGTVEVAAGSSVTVAGTFTQIGSSSLTTLNGGTFSSAAFALRSGKLTGTGTINGAVTVTGGGAILPGGSGGIGALTFNHTLTLEPSSDVYFELGGIAPATGYDRINGASIALNGSLFLSFANGFQFTIAPADTFTLFSTSVALGGTFGGLANGARFATTDGFGTFQINYLPNALEVSNFQAIPEPSTFALLGLGAIAVLLVERRRRHRA